MEEQEKHNQETQDEDEIVVAKMNVDGMPWYTPPLENGSQSQEGDPPSHKETMRMMGGALKAALLVGGAFAVGLLVFLLFCVYVWFR